MNYLKRAYKIKRYKTNSYDKLKLGTFNNWFIHRGVKDLGAKNGGMFTFLGSKFHDTK
jgi:hypothetical protein